MKTRTLKDKLFSRKFLAAVAGFVAGLAVIFGLDKDVISDIAGAVISAASVLTYIITEGKIDAESVKNAAEDIQSGIEVIQGD